MPEGVTTDEPTQIHCDHLNAFRTKALCDAGLYTLPINNVVCPTLLYCAEQSVWPVCHQLNPQIPTTFLSFAVTDLLFISIHQLFRLPANLLNILAVLASSKCHIDGLSHTYLFYFLNS